MIIIALNMPTQVEKDNAFIKQDQEDKAKLESIVAKEIKNLFKVINIENTQSIMTTGNSIAGSEHKAEWRVLLKNHYTRVQNKFENRIAALLPEEDRNLTEEETKNYLAALLLWKKEKTQESSEQIIDTNNKQIKESVNQARQALIEDGQEVTNRDLAVTTAAIFKRKINPRVGTIAETETQTSAESTKLIEASIFSGLTAEQIFKPSVPRPIIKSIKIWRTASDDVVRNFHAAINGVKRAIDKAFDSGGESLMHPGDTSLGATLKNIANCRCSLTYRIIRMRLAA
jgi:uncharacterized protein YeaC (DUF1315 family)